MKKVIGYAMLIIIAALAFIGLIGWIWGSTGKEIIIGLLPLFIVAGWVGLAFYLIGKGHEESIRKKATEWPKR